MSTHDHPSSDPSRDPYAFYASPVGPRTLDQANRIFEDFPVWKHLLYFIVFMLEVAAVFYIGIQLAP
jgi:hypothetical protein